jgi:sulfur carrier protein ThiS adenylyltransferase
MKIGIAGVGGIGSNVAVHLVRSGIKTLKIVDFDRVEAANLNRQFYFQDQIGRPKVAMLACNLNRIAADLDIEALAIKLDQKNMATTFADCHVVVEGLDGQEHKKMLLEALADSGKIIVSASGVAGSHVDTIAVRRFGPCTLVGDFQTDCRHADLYSHKVATIAAMMAGVVLERSGCVK